MQFEAEAARQFALERYDVLDTPAEASFDHITMAMKLALDVPFAGISFMDGDRLWFKSKSGLSPTEIPRDISFCDFAIAQQEPLIVEDTLRDERFRENPVVIDRPFFRSYLGVPLITPDGFKIGTLCAADLIPRQYSEEKIDRMKQLAELVIHELEFRQQSKKDRLTGALSRSGFAVEVQNAMSLYERQGIKSTLVVFDVDLYKMVSKRFGRPSGNALLRSIIQPLVKRLRRSDYIGRLGGTQFAVLLTCTVEEKARLAAGKIRKELKQTNSEIFFDLGFSEISPAMGVCDDWLEQASIDLIAGKKAARAEMCEAADRQYDMAGGAG
ncbi:sensor domain-containing diguanylate cyclase [Sphingorhabdus sp. YGSMI21]|uniref:sensor domain-containing diguanylate cyclase n=1 Tax=Sphingorhabdus sp. YGSMI21 TaxID=2077182 RepID=UPI0013DB373B|nr:sensor domain-containing diguanylate cyclase [Sphingorhabdus sp. YGSMI21]